MSEDTERITRLEEMLAHQAKTIDDLSDQIARHFETTARLETALKRLGERVTAMDEPTADGSPEPPPPHY